jgi:hypothetical protein
MAAAGDIRSAAIAPTGHKKTLKSDLISGSCWLRGQDLNLRPSGYEPDELPDCSTPRQYVNALARFDGLSFSSSASRAARFNARLRPGTLKDRHETVKDSLGPDSRKRPLGPSATATVRRQRHVKRSRDPARTASPAAGSSEKASLHALARPGDDLLSRALRRSTIGAEGLHGRVRDGIGCGPLAIATKSCKGTQQRSRNRPKKARLLSETRLHDGLRHGEAANNAGNEHPLLTPASDDASAGKGLAAAHDGRASRSSD